MVASFLHILIRFVLSKNGLQTALHKGIRFKRLIGLDQRSGCIPGCIEYLNLESPEMNLKWKSCSSDCATNGWWMCDCEHKPKYFDTIRQLLHKSPCIWKWIPNINDFFRSHALLISNISTNKSGENILRSVKTDSHRSMAFSHHAHVKVNDLWFQSLFNLLRSRISFSFIMIKFNVKTINHNLPFFNVCCTKFHNKSVLKCWLFCGLLKMQ